jgi:hypothetical protein
LLPTDRAGRSSRTRTVQEFWLLREKEKTLVAKLKKSRNEVFLNIPYDKKFERLFIAYIAGIGAYVMFPFGAHVTAIDSSGRRA